MHEPDNVRLIGRELPLHVTKYDGSYHRRVPLRFVHRKAPLTLGVIERGRPVSRTPDLADDPDPHIIQWGGDIYLFEDRWYMVQRSPRDGRTLYYVDIATPVEFDGEGFANIDLDLDVWWWADDKPRVLDEDEFLDHSRAMGYPADVIERARAAVDEVLGLIGERAFPFDRP
jgi:hypothetical protein